MLSPNVSIVHEEQKELMSGNWKVNVTLSSSMIVRCTKLMMVAKGNPITNIALCKMA